MRVFENTTFLTEYRIPSPEYRIPDFPILYSPVFYLLFAYIFGGIGHMEYRVRTMSMT